MKFIKMQGAANDFILVEANGKKRDWPKLAIVMCDRHLGIGADSLLVLLPSKVADFEMRTFDTDGSEAETCGNGIRCVARYAFDKGLLRNGADHVMIKTVAGMTRVSLDSKGGRLVRIQANMGRPRLGADEIPVKITDNKDKIVSIKSMLSYPITVDGTELVLNFVSMGNPHAVHFSEQSVADFPLAQLGTKVENHPIFPHRVNFEVARVLGPKHLEARVWERGVGETLACGSGACAITVAARLRGLVGNKVDIKLPGGVLEVEWDGKGEVFLSGPAGNVFAGEWPDDKLS